MMQGRHPFIQGGVSSICNQEGLIMVKREDAQEVWSLASGALNVKRIMGSDYRILGSKAWDRLEQALQV